MPELLAVTVGRRSYEYGLDRIRLSVICTDRVLGAIAEAFHFQVRAIATPPATFAVPDSTSPPGAIFQNGQLEDQGAPLVPIRGLYFEPRRIVVDIAGHNELAERVHVRLMDILAGIPVEEGQPIMGQLRSRRDYSELVVRMASDLSTTISPGLRDALQPAADRDQILVPAVYVTIQPTADDYRGLVIGEPIYSIQQRAGTPAEAHEWFSGAPLDSREHLRYLTRLERAVGPDERAVAG